MKSILVIISIILIARKVTASNAVVSNPQDIEDLKNVAKLKALFADIQPIIWNVIHDLPSDKRYDKYRKDLELFLNLINHKSGKVCFEKYFEDLTVLASILTGYVKEDASDEANKVLNLFVIYGHNDFLNKQWKILHKLDLVKLKKNIKHLDKNDAKFILLTETC
ncbi:uncharacterized protein LOC106087621 [Stomoxys calcitrans]|uniref:Uncharacterized protein n=1 Tax=Stomoxys calcitrans TaxID=35570 RepID=A0A1I8NMM7_STOCA|nr:uncharacterized protein LOC106087621 [Stomoxys calcitrans]